MKTRKCHSLIPGASRQYLKHFLEHNEEQSNALVLEGGRVALLSLKILESLCIQAYNCNIMDNLMLRNELFGVGYKQRFLM